MKQNINKYPETDELLENAADILLYIEYLKNDNSPQPKGRFEKKDILFFWYDCSALFFGFEDNGQKLARFISAFELKLNKSQNPNFNKIFNKFLNDQGILKKSNLYRNQDIRKLIGHLRSRNQGTEIKNAFLPYKRAWRDKKEELFNILKGNPQTEDIKASTAQSLSDNLKNPNKNEIDVYTDFEYDTETPGAITLVDMEGNQFIYGGFIELEMEFMSIVGDPSEKTKEENNSALYKAIKKLDSQGKYSEDELNSITELFCTNHKKYLSQ